MPTLFVGLLALALVLWLMKSFVQVDPRYLVKVARTAGGVLALAGAAFLGSRGLIYEALPLGVTGLGAGTLGYLPVGTGRFWPTGQKSSAGQSQVRSNFIDMKLDHDSGAMTGTIIAGRLQRHAARRA